MCRSRPRSTRKARALSRGGFSTYVQCVHMTGGLCGPCERGLSAGAADWAVLSVRMLCGRCGLTSFIPTIHSTALSLSHYPIRIRFTRFIALCVVVQPFSPLEAAPRAIGRAFTRGSYRPAPVFAFTTGNGYLRDSSSTAYTNGTCAVSAFNATREGRSARAYMEQGRGRIIPRVRRRLEELAEDARRLVVPLRHDQWRLVPPIPQLSRKHGIARN